MNRMPNPATVQQIVYMMRSLGVTMTETEIVEAVNAHIVMARDPSGGQRLIHGKAMLRAIAAGDDGDQARQLRTSEISVPDINGPSLEAIVAMRQVCGCPRCDGDDEGARS